MIRNIAMGLVAATLIAAPALAQRDGTPGNPPSTATQRTLDRATGSAPTPADGTRGNPPGTAAGRAVDRATGSNTTGANPSHGTGVSRAPMNDTTHRGTTGTTTAPAR
jgi:hypothetical protein